MIKISKELVVYLFTSILLIGCITSVPSKPLMTPSPTTSQSPEFTPTQLIPTKILATMESPCQTPEKWNIDFQREGGIMGLTQMLNISSDGSIKVEDTQKEISFDRTLDFTQIQDIENLLLQACPFETQKTKQTCADCFEYALSINMEGTVYRVKVKEDSIPEAMQPLIGYLNKLFQQMSTP